MTPLKLGDHVMFVYGPGNVISTGTVKKFLSHKDNKGRVKDVPVVVVKNEETKHQSIFTIEALTKIPK